MKKKETRTYVKRDARGLEKTDRLCRACNKPLPASLYFRHDRCKLSDWYYSGDEYGASSSKASMAKGLF